MQNQITIAAETLQKQGYETRKEGEGFNVYASGGWVGALTSDGEIQGSKDVSEDIALALNS